MDSFSDLSDEILLNSIQSWDQNYLSMIFENAVEIWDDDVSILDRSFTGQQLLESLDQIEN